MMMMVMMMRACEVSGYDVSAILSFLTHSRRHFVTTLPLTQINFMMLGTYDIGFFLVYFLRFNLGPKNERKHVYLY